jgi:hypothetical protein
MSPEVGVYVIIAELVIRAQLFGTQEQSSCTKRLLPYEDYAYLPQKQHTIG